MLYVGTPEERGIEAWRNDLQDCSPNSSMVSSSCYDLPFGMDAIRRWPWTKYIPVCPTFGGHRCSKQPETVKHSLDETQLDSLPYEDDFDKRVSQI